MMKIKKLLLGTAVCGLIGLGAIPANAVDVDIDATLDVSSALTVASTTDIDFASIDFAATHSGVIEYGPDGTSAVTSGSGLTPSGSPVAGQISITESAATLDISCDATAMISDGSVEVLISEIVWDTAAVAPNYAGATNTCGGLGVGAVSIDTSILANNDPVINIGAQITVDSNELASGSTLDTSTGNGDPITFRIVVQ